MRLAKGTPLVYQGALYYVFDYRGMGFYTLCRTTDGYFTILHKDSIPEAYEFYQGQRLMHKEDGVLTPVFFFSVSTPGLIVVLNKSGRRFPVPIHSVTFSFESNQSMVHLLSKQY